MVGRKLAGRDDSSRDLVSTLALDPQAAVRPLSDGAGRAVQQSVPGLLVLSAALAVGGSRHALGQALAAVAAGHCALSLCRLAAAPRSTGQQALGEVCSQGAQVAVQQLAGRLVGAMMKGPQA